MRWALEQVEGLRRDEHHLLCYVAFKDGSEEGCFASIETIAGRLGISESSVRRAFRVLVKRGLVTEEARSGRSNSYRVPLSACKGCHPDTPVTDTPVTDTRTEKEHPSPSERTSSKDGKRSSSRKKKTTAPPSRWIEVWNGIAGEVPGIHPVRVFGPKAESSLLRRAAELGLSPERLEHELAQALPRLSEKAKGWVTLSWLATGQQAGLQKLLNGDYEGDRNGSSAEDDFDPSTLYAEGDPRYGPREPIEARVRRRPSDSRPGG
jgi:hypothetical protein